MRETRSVSISLIDMDSHPLNPSTLALVYHLSSGLSVPPIRLARVGGGRFKIRDGRHRVTAHKLLGRKVILASFHTNEQ